MFIHNFCVKFLFTYLAIVVARIYLRLTNKYKLFNLFCYSIVTIYQTKMTTTNKTKEHVVNMIIMMNDHHYHSHDHQYLIILPAGSQIQQTKANVVVNSQIQTAAGILSDKFCICFKQILTKNKKTEKLKIKFLLFTYTT